MASLFLALFPELRAEVARWLGRRDAYALALSCGAGLCAAETARTLPLLTLPRQWQDVLTGRQRHWMEMLPRPRNLGANRRNLVRALVYHGIEIGVLSDMRSDTWYCKIHYNQRYSIHLFDDDWTHLEGVVDDTWSTFLGPSADNFFRKMWYDHIDMPLEIRLVPPRTHCDNVIDAVRHGWLDCVCCCKR